MNIQELRKQALKSYKNNNIAKAITHYKLILKLELEDWSLHWDIAYLFRKNKQYKNAIAHYQNSKQIKA